MRSKANMPWKFKEVMRHVPWCGMCLVVVVDPVGCQLGGCGLCGVGGGLQLLVLGGCLSGVGVLSWWWIVVLKVA